MNRPIITHMIGEEGMTLCGVSAHGRFMTSGVVINPTCKRCVRRLKFVVVYQREEATQPSHPNPVDRFAITGEALGDAPRFLSNLAPATLDLVSDHCVLLRCKAMVIDNYGNGVQVAFANDLGWSRT